MAHAKLNSGPNRISKNDYWIEKTVRENLCMNESYRILEWDSQFFEFPVAEISTKNLTVEQIRCMLDELRKHEIRLVFWASLNRMDEHAMSALNGILANQKITYLCDLSAQHPLNWPGMDRVVPYTSSVPVSDLEHLALLSGSYSRFNVDPRIPNKKFKMLYKQWIHKSLSHEMADEVLVIRVQNQTAGMVTVGQKQGRGDIGLVAVDSPFRGKGYGEMLVRAAQKYWIDRAYSMMQVVTQKSNIPACRLYQKCGFFADHSEFLYHIWL